MFLVGTVYHFCTPHESLPQAQQTTPAMAAGITDHRWTMHELLSWHVPPPRWTPPKQRGRPSHIPTVCLDAISLVASSCGDTRGESEPRGAQSFAVHVAPQSRLAERPQHRRP